jgi:hypothetical protein
MAKKDVITYTTPPFIAAFTQGVFEAQDGPDGGPKKFNLTAIWTPKKFTEKDQRLWKLIREGLEAEAQAKFKMAWTELGEAGIKTGLRKGEAKKDLEGFGPGTIFATLSSKYEPSVCDINKDDVSPADGNDDLVRPGALMRAKVRIYSYANKGKGVGLGIQSLQVISADEDKYPRLDHRTSAADDFGDDDDSLDGSYLDQAEESVGGGSDWE